MSWNSWNDSPKSGTRVPEPKEIIILTTECYEIAKWFCSSHALKVGILTTWNSSSRGFNIEHFSSWSHFNVRNITNEYVNSNPKMWYPLVLQCNLCSYENLHLPKKKTQPTTLDDTIYIGCWCSSTGAVWSTNEPTLVGNPPRFIITFLMQIEH